MGLAARKLRMTPPAGGGSSFTPTDLTGLIGWWDASEAGDFTYSSGTVISQWNDRSGNGYHLSASPTGEPSRDTTVNGLGAVTFSNNNALDVDAGSDVIDISPWTYWCVVDLAATADFDRIFTSRRSATGAFDYQSPNAIFAYRASNTSGVYDVSAFSAGTQGSTVTGSSGLMIVGSRQDGTSLYVSVNGVESSATTVTASGNMRYLRMGGITANTGNPPAAADSNSLQGVVCEHFLTNESVTDAAAVNYLADKWGITL